MSADTTNTAKSGLDVLFAAIDYQQSSSSDETTPLLSLPSSSTSSKQPTPPNQNPAERVSVNPFRSKMDPRMRKSIEARALNPNMLDEEAVLAGFKFPERGTSADIKWIGEGNVSMRQRKINFRRSWKRFESRQNKEVSTEMALSIPRSSVMIPSSPISVHGAKVSCSDGPHHEDPSSTVSAPSALDHLSVDSMSREPAVPLVLPKKRKAKSFPQTLISVISNPEYDHIISWLPSGEAFGIHNRKVFESEILPKYFRHSRFSNFVRKLTRWGFRRESKNSADVAYKISGSMIFCHEAFKRDDTNCMSKNSVCNSTFEFRKVSIDAMSNNEAAECQATSTSAMTTLRPSIISVGPEDLVLVAPQPPDLMMVDLNRLLIQTQLQLDYMTQKTKHSRALLYGSLL